MKKNDPYAKAWWDTVSLRAFLGWPRRHRGGRSRVESATLVVQISEDVTSWFPNANLTERRRS